LRSHTDHDAVLNLVQSFHDEPTRNPLNRLGIQAVRVAQQLRKPITVSTAENGLRLPATRFEDLWLSAVHMVRNAVDHGFESVDARLAADKDPTGTITLSTTMVGENLVIACNDDGGGVDWQRVADKARTRGLACSTHDELVDALFSDGLSTRDEVSDWSGRGVGLSAVKAAVTALGGSVRVASTPRRWHHHRVGCAPARCACGDGCDGQQPCCLMIGRDLGDTHRLAKVLNLLMNPTEASGQTRACIFFGRPAPLARSFQA
jgi:hypothetical protein